MVPAWPKIITFDPNFKSQNVTLKDDSAIFEKPYDAILFERHCPLRPRQLCKIKFINQIPFQNFIFFVMKRNSKNKPAEI